MQPTPEEARIALATAQAAENATVNRPVPAWFYPVLAGLILVRFTLNSLDATTGAIRVITMVLILALAIGIGGLVGKIRADQPGYKGIHIPWGPTILMTLIAAAFPIAAIALDDAIGSWVWVVAGAALASFLLVTGVSYQRKYRHG